MSTKTLRELHHQRDENRGPNKSITLHNLRTPFFLLHKPGDEGSTNLRVWFSVLSTSYLAQNGREGRPSREQSQSLRQYGTRGFFWNEETEMVSSARARFRGAWPTGCNYYFLPMIVGCSSFCSFTNEWSLLFVSFFQLPSSCSIIVYQSSW